MKGVFPIWLIVVVLIGAGMIYGGGNLFSTTSLSDAVWCNDYEFVCSGMGTTSSVTGSVLNYGNQYICQSDECQITITQNAGSSYFIAPATASCSTNILGAVTCSPQITYSGADYRVGTFTMRLNEHFYATAQMTYNAIRKDANLKYCGDAACDASVTGISVLGANKNTFITDKRIYDPSGTVVREPLASGISYTVPVSSCILSPKSQQVLCGSKYSQCSADSDCAAGHTYLINGKGAEASTGFLSIYGCKDYGSAPSFSLIDVLPSESTPNITYGKRCEVISQQQVQCTSNTMCGSNAVCDTGKTWTCIQSNLKQCSSDWECGTQNVYDQPSKQIRKPTCSSGTCGYSVVKTVQCYYNTECSAGWYCDTDYTCKEQTNPKQACPNECCVNDARYFDRLPPTGQVCCPSGRVADDLAACSGEPSSGLGWFEMIVIILLIILAIFVLPKLVK